MNNTNSNFESIKLQKVFIAAMAVSFFGALFYQMYTVLAQYTSSGFVGAASLLYFIGLAAPVFYFVLALLLHSGNQLRVKAFDSILVAVVGTALHGALSLLTIRFFQLSSLNRGAYQMYLVYDAVLYLIVFVALGVFLLRLKKSQKW